jgi:elongation factor G
MNSARYAIVVHMARGRPIGKPMASWSNPTLGDTGEILRAGNAMTNELDKIFFRETVQGSSNGEAKFVRQRGARSEYAHVRVSVRPAERGRGAIVEWNAGVNIPAHFSSAVLRGIHDALHAGAAGLEVTDIHVSVDDGSHHVADSNDESFREAAHEAALQAIQRAGPKILEAMSLVLITLPAVQVEVAEIAVARLGGEATPAVQKEDGSKALAANMPTASVNDLIEELLHATGGNTTISSRSNGYRPRLDPHESPARRTAGAPRR